MNSFSANTDKSVKDAIRNDLQTAMKSGDQVTKDTLRMILAAVIQEQTSGKEASELNEEQFLALLRREVKKRHEAAEIFANNSRAELAEKELAEANVIERYLPPPLTDAELSQLIDAAILEVVSSGAPSKKDFGSLMKNVKSAAGAQADGARISAAINARIAG